MRYSIALILAVVCCFIGSFVGAEWSTDDTDVSWFPRETGIAGRAAVRAGWSPKPTTAPGSPRPQEEQILDVLLKRENTWLNSKTCGWVSGPSSDPFTCGESSTCTTNSENVVACASGTLSPFYKTCLDFSAYQRGSCEGQGQEIGCCMDSRYGSCATYLWTNRPTRSMYRCSNVTTTITMLDVPQFVVDASLSASAVQTPTNIEPLSSGVYPGSEIPSSDTSGISVGAIIGIVFGSILCLILIGYMLLKCHSYLKKAKEDHNNVQNRLDNAFQPPRTPRIRGLAMSAFVPEPNTPAGQPQPDASSSVYSQDSATPATPAIPPRSANRASAPVYTRVDPESPHTPSPHARYLSAYDRSPSGVSGPPRYEWHQMHVRVRPESSPVQGYNTPPPRYSLYPTVQTRLSAADMQAVTEGRVHALVQNQEDAVLWVNREPTTSSMGTEGPTEATNDLK
ncbi:hypothetical protein F5Y00DRAFT_270081 [Daldinia vernicosa]|uniref:uncharacterized protein n=1 Tax=Daldinia vernicosa TaxID=114800 RepID=UPI0020076954|nr:uncharacterized protein F5Y00DRAFT_270081 [Daldinia vernicosa]KAI0848596.1 hypothetical protein F5Y00DRAFT_270081 [Daldinia vernicosa]